MTTHLASQRILLPTVPVKSLGKGSITLPSALYPSGEAFESIATSVVTQATASSVTFSSIPSVFTHLQIRLISRTDYIGDNSTGLKMTFNSDTNTNYSWHRWYGIRSGSGTSGQGTTASHIRIDRMIARDVVDSAQYGCAIVDILDYANTNKYKTSRSFGGWDNNAAGWTGMNSGNWRSTSAITSITISDADSTNLPNYSHFALYGIRTA